MAITPITPAGLPETGLYHQAVVASGTRLVFVAGQVAVDVDGATVGVGDVAAQTERCYLNVATALAAAGATFDDVARITAYVVDWTPDKMPQLVEGIARAAAVLGTTPMAPLTGIGVAALAGPDLLVEVEATAVLD